MRDLDRDLAAIDRVSAIGLGLAAVLLAGLAFCAWMGWA